MFYRLYLDLSGWFLRWRNRYWTHQPWMSTAVCFSYPGDNVLHWTNRPELWEGWDLNWSIVEYPRDGRDGGWVRTVSYEDALHHLYTGDVPVWVVYQQRGNADHVYTHFYTREQAREFCHQRWPDFYYYNLETKTSYKEVRVWQ